MVNTPYDTKPEKYKKYRKATGSNILDSLFGAQGIKTDVSVKIAPGTIPIIIISVMVAVGAGILIAGAIQKAIKK
jgi:hypothetical protein